MQQGLSTWLMGTVWALEIVKLTNSNSSSFLDLGELILCMHSAVFNQRLKTGGEALKGQFFCVAHSTFHMFSSQLSLASLTHDLCSSAREDLGSRRNAGNSSPCAVVQNRGMWWHQRSSPDLLSFSQNPAMTLVRCLKTFVSYTLSSFLVVHGRWASSVLATPHG